MSGFVLHPEIFKDLDEIREFIATDSLNAADRVPEEIHEAIRRLVHFLNWAILAPILLPDHYDFIPCEIFIAYAPDEKAFVVIANPRVNAAFSRERG
jgi:plasmid stabilization system protein ParE